MLRVCVSLTLLVVNYPSMPSNIGIDNIVIISVTKPLLRTPKSKRVSDGSKLRIKCKVTNRAYPAPAIAWYKDGALLTRSHAHIDTKK